MSLTTIVPMSPTGLGLECYHLHELTTTPLVVVTLRSLRVPVVDFPRNTTISFNVVVVVKESVVVVMVHIHLGHIVFMHMFVVSSVTTVHRQVGGDVSW